MRCFRILFIAAGLVLAGLSPVLGQSKVKERFGEWQVECDPGKAPASCVISFVLLSPKDKKVAFAWSILPGKDAGTTKAVIRTLNGTLLPAGISVKIPDQDVQVIPYLTCGPRLCFAELQFADSWLKAFKAQKAFSVTYKVSDGREIKHDVSLDKFTQAYDFYLANLSKSN